VDDHPDSGGTDSLTHGTTAGNLTFGFAALSLPAAATAITVLVDYYDLKNGSQACNIGARLKIGGTYHNATTHNPANGVRTLRTDTFATNPKTGAAWTVADVNGTGANPLQAFGWVSTDASPTVGLSSIQLRVQYTLQQPVTAVSANDGAWAARVPLRHQSVAAVCANAGTWTPVHIDNTTGAAQTLTAASTNSGTWSTRAIPRRQSLTAASPNAGTFEAVKRPSPPPQAFPMRFLQPRSE
jgi:hypothetical protein